MSVLAENSNGSIVVLESVTGNRNLTMLSGYSLIATEQRDLFVAIASSSDEYAVAAVDVDWYPSLPDPSTIAGVALNTGFFNYLVSRKMTATM